MLVIHILISFLLVLVILLQAGKGGGLASAFGGSGTTDAVFGGRQAATFLTKATMVLGALFMLMSMTLAIISSFSSGPRSVVQEQLQGSPLPVSSSPAPQPAAGSDLLQGGGTAPAGGASQPAQPAQQPAQPQNQNK